jgi:catechol 2,3-dioxygenase-like lactoylglutathione lyase family enzyme
MKRLHIHLAVQDLARSVGFYSALFGAAPVVLKGDYAKWMLDDPHVNFAISDRAPVLGVDHLGIQVDSGAELAALAGRLRDAGAVTRDQVAATCCYAKSDKAWVNDPDGVRWESFHSFGDSVIYGEDAPGMGAAVPAGACC